MERRRRLFSKKKLYKENEQIFFTEIVEVGLTYRYYSSHYHYIDVKKVARKYGVETKYNTSSSTEYILYGCYNFTVVSINDPDKKQIEPQLFDVNELAL